MPEPTLVVRERPASVVDLGDDLLSRVYAARGVREAVEVDNQLKSLLPPSQLTDIDKAAKRLTQAIVTDQRILIVGDFDADGATSVALCMLLLREFGASQVSYLVPNRFEFGYGLSPEIVALAAKQKPDLIVTVDNGVASVQGVNLANSEGIDVVITDHHLPGDTLPDAHAIVNPNMQGCQFPSKAMAGVGVAYYLLGVVRAQLRAQGWFDARKEPNLAEYLDLVALGTVADVVPLDQNNRILVHQGLLRIRAGRARPGILALCQLGKRDPRTLVAADLGFAVGPRLNAAGRLDDMSIGIQCLLATEFTDARRLAVGLDELNQARRELEQDMVAEAELIVASQAGFESEEGAQDRYGVCVYEEGWHQGVVGIVAARLKEKIHRPVIAFAEAGAAASDELKGSARSIPGLHIRDVLDLMASRVPGLILKFGGHAMAAGLSLKRVHYRRFAKLFDSVVAELLPATALLQAIETDGELTDAEFNLPQAERLAAAGPWGQGFPEPVFQGVFELVTQRIVGQQHLKVVLRVTQDLLVDGIAFRQRPIEFTANDKALPKRVLVAYRLAVNDYRDVRTLQLMIEHIRPSA